MAFVVARPGGRYELRRSFATPDGPRSETLASFRELSPAVTERAVLRGGGSLTVDDVREAALRAGAPVGPDGARRSAAHLIGALARGDSLPAGWRPLLVELLEGRGADPGAEAIGQWADASPERRGAVLYDLLLLADAIPRRARSGALAFPGLRTVPR